MKRPVCLGDATSSGAKVVVNGLSIVLDGHRLECGCHGVASHAATVKVG